MRIKILLIILLLFVLSGCSKTNKEFNISGNLKNDIINLFPTGKVDVNIMKITVSPENRKRYDEIVGKMITCYEANKADFQNTNIWKLEERIYKLKEGVLYASMIPWDNRLGIRADEYNGLSGLFDFCKTSRGVVLIEKADNNNLVIKAEQDINNLDYIKLNIPKKTVSSEYGIYKYVNFKKASDESDKVIADRWGFYTWTIDTNKSSINDPKHYNSFYIGQIKKTNEIIVFLRNDNNDEPEHQDIILSFKPKEN